MQRQWRQEGSGGGKEKAAAAAKRVVLDNDNNEEDNGVILSGVCIVLPHFITRRSFCRQPLAQTRNGWLLFAWSAALFVITHHPVIVEDTPI